MADELVLYAPPNRTLMLLDKGGARGAYSCLDFSPCGRMVITGGCSKHSGATLCCKRALQPVNKCRGAALKWEEACTAKTLR